LKKHTAGVLPQNKWFYFFTAPYLLLMLVFMAFPLFFSFYISFFDWSGVTAGTFTGLRNYIQIVSAPLFWNVLGNTLFIGIVHLPIEIGLAVLFAVLLNQSWLKISGVFRTALFLPSITSLVVVAMVFFMIFDQTYGLLNLFLGVFDIPPVPWLVSPEYSKISIIILLIWRWTGYITIIMLSGLQSIPEELYESARIDGAGSFSIFFTITLPLMKPVILFAAIMGTSGLFALFAEPYILTGGGPNNSSLTTGLLLYREGFQYFHFGSASAIAYILFCITLIFSLLQMRLLNGQKDYSGV
jgi:lactose/L-arabinose transport system permease protein